MALQYETGHGVNVGNFEQYRQFLVTLGSGYSPSPAEISLAALDALQAAARTSLDDVKTAEDLWKTETNLREKVFSQLANISTRMIGMLQAANVSKQTLDDLRSLATKVRGGARRQAPTETQEPGAEPASGDTERVVTRSSSQMSFNQRIENFSRMVLLVKGVAAYAPTEADLSVQGLEALHAELVAANSRATKADAELRAARLKRDEVLYAPETGLLDRVKLSKAYIQGAFGRTSNQFKSASAYKFSRNGK